jgi:AGCS family alanine or glycine:cation symporter
MDLNALILRITDVICGWPLVIYVFGISIIITIALRFVQVRYFLASWRMVLMPEKKEAKTNGDMTPFQAFLNALSASLGNGSIGGMATALYAGGPGAALWVFVFGFFSMAVRFAEVFLSISFPAAEGAVLGGPMVYLKHVPGRTILPYLYAFFCMMLGFVVGNGMQANTMTQGIVHIFGISELVCATLLLLFIGYVMFGGAHRIVAVSDAIVPIKVGLFFISAIIVLVYHYASLLPALKLIIASAFSSKAIAGGAIGYSVQQALRFGIFLGVNASEAGVGSAAILFGGTGSKEPIKSGIMAMLSTFISANLVCFMVMLMIIASGVLNSGFDSLRLTIAAYETVYGHLGGWIVTFLSMSFGLGVLVTYSYITRSCWLFLTNGRFEWLFTVLFCAMSFFGAISKVAIIWNSTDLINAGLLAINLFALIWLLPMIRKAVIAYDKQS